MHLIPSHIDNPVRHKKQLVPGEARLVDFSITSLQWVAMAVTLIAAWLVASQSKGRRSSGFWCFILSNALWILWGWYDGAYALIGLQIGLFFLNVRGAKKNEPVATKN
jgi:hypothetical protein